MSLWYVVSSWRVPVRKVDGAALRILVGSFWMKRMITDSFACNCGARANTEDSEAYGTIVITDKKNGCGMRWGMMDDCDTK